MIIYIDESGIFANPNRNEHLVSVVGAFVVPERCQIDLFRNLGKLLKRWGDRKEKIKGSKLDEVKVASFINLLAKYDILFKPVIIDIGMHSKKQIEEHKVLQADRVTAQISSAHHPNMVKQLTELRDRIKQLSNPLYVQAVCLTVLCADVLQSSTLYYSQRNPHTLGRFRGVIDAKSEKLTEYEKVWELIVRPMLQSRSLHEPLIELMEGDYSHFRHDIDPDMEIDHLSIHMEKPVLRSNFFKLNDIFREKIEFRNSRDSLGLRATDILVTTLRRACQRTLQKSGWKRIGQLIPQDQKPINAVRMVSLGEITISKTLPYSHVIDHIDRTAKPMLKQSILDRS